MISTKYVAPVLPGRCPRSSSETPAEADANANAHANAHVHADPIADHARRLGAQSHRIGHECVVRDWRWDGVRRRAAVARQRGRRGGEDERDRVSRRRGIASSTVHRDEVLFDSVSIIQLELPSNNTVIAAPFVTFATLFGPRPPRSHIADRTNTSVSSAPSSPSTTSATSQPPTSGPSRTITRCTTISSRRCMSA
jgi:hypothetical protein